MYALVRAMRPDHLVETGTDKTGSCVLAAALLANDYGRLYDYRHRSARRILISGKFATVVDLVIGDSVAALKKVKWLASFTTVTIRQNMKGPSFEAVASALTPGSIVLSTTHTSRPIAEWAESSGQ